MRPHAWRLAQRRHTARVWHREKDIDPEVARHPRRAGQADRRPAPGAAAHPAGVGVDAADGPRGRAAAWSGAERELQAGAAAVSRSPSTSRPPRCARSSSTSPPPSPAAAAGRAPRSCAAPGPPVAAPTPPSAWSAPSRPWSSRGSLVTDADRRAPHARPGRHHRGPPTTGPGARAAAEAVPVAARVVAARAPTTCSARYAGRTLDPGRTGDNSAGNGLALPCQQERYADPRGRAGAGADLRGRRPGARTASRRPAHRGLGLRARRAPHVRHHQRLVRRLHRAAGPAPRHPHPRGASATTPSSSCCGAGRRR